MRCTGSIQEGFVVLEDPLLANFGVTTYQSFDLVP